MQLADHPTGFTFAVDDVYPTPKEFPECRAHEALRRSLGSLESCSDYHGLVLSRIDCQPLLAAVYLAFSEHRPLVLTPDAVWITITQGVAHHMAVHAERLRQRFVLHDGKVNLVFRCAGWVQGSPENPWHEAFDAWGAKIREHVGAEVHDALVCDFGTTGAVERAASQIVMMDIFQRYFQYELCCICGIPAITLEGTSSDWERLRQKAAALRVFELDWWLEHLLPLCDQFVRASRGDIDLPHWQGICKLRSAYGGDIINGWIAKLFPYLREYVDGPCSRRNPIFETGEGFQTLVAPSGLSTVPFVWIDATSGKETLMEAIGGLVGVIQHPQSGRFALQPQVGWAIKKAAKMDALVRRVSESHQTFADARGKPATRDIQSDLPADLAQFCHDTGGAMLRDPLDATCRIGRADEFMPLDWAEIPEHGNSRGPEGRIWHRFAWLSDGGWLAINLDMNRRDPRPKADNARRDHLFSPICVCRPNSQGVAGQNPVVALSFSELLERLLDGQGRFYWLDSQWTSYGDAELFTRRD